MCIIRWPLALALALALALVFGPCLGLALGLALGFGLWFWPQPRFDLLTTYCRLCSLSWFVLLCSVCRKDLRGKLIELLTEMITDHTVYVMCHSRLTLCHYLRLILQIPKGD